MPRIAAAGAAARAADTAGDNPVAAAAGAEPVAGAPADAASDVRGCYSVQDTSCCWRREARTEPRNRWYYDGRATANETEEEDEMLPGAGRRTVTVVEVIECKPWAAAAGRMVRTAGTGVGVRTKQEEESDDSAPVGTVTVLVSVGVQTGEEEVRRGWENSAGREAAVHTVVVGAEARRIVVVVETAIETVPAREERTVVALAFGEERTVVAPAFGEERTAVAPAFEAAPR